MSKQSKTFDFHPLHEALTRIGAMAGAAEAHGILCGLICAEGKSDAATWLSHVLGEQDPGNVLVKETRSMLIDLQEATMEQITGGDYALQLLIRDDDESMEERLADLGQWCQGFLVGLSLGGVKDYKDLPAEAAEIANDFLEITRVGFDEREDVEQNEADLAEIIEYARMGVFVVYGELNPNAPVPPEPPAVH